MECKNLIGDIEITNKGEFIRSTSYGGRNKLECIYFPITQNKRHLELLREIKLDGKGILESLTINSNFDDVYRSFVVLANPKTILKDRYATRDVKSQVIRADQLIDTIRRINDEPRIGKTSLSWNMTVELAESFLQYHYEPDIEDAIQQRFEEIVSESAKFKDELPMPSSEPVESILRTGVPSCPVCGSPMILRTAKRGKRAGNQFYGCSNYPHCRGIVNLSDV